MMNDTALSLAQATLEELIAFADQRGLDRSETISNVIVALYLMWRGMDFTKHKEGEKQ